MELRHLHYFVAVAEEQNITRAARRLNISQPPLSRQIRDLEELLGVELFERTGKSIVLSDAGEVFLVEARAVLLRAEQAVQAVRAVAEGDRGDLHVGYSPSLTVGFLPQALRAFQGSTPAVRVHLHDLSTEEMLRGLHEKTLDVALMVRPVAGTGQGITFEELHRYAVCVAMSPWHPLTRCRKLTLERVAKEPLLVYSRKEYPEHLLWVESLFAPLGLKRSLRIAGEHDSASSLVTTLEAGASVAMVQEGFECFSGPRLVVRPVEPPPPPLRIGLAWRKQLRAGATGRFLDAVREAVAGIAKTA